MIDSGFLRSVRAGYDAVAVEMAEYCKDGNDSAPLGKAMLGAFAEVVQGPVADIGCGAGDITAHLHRLGLDVQGIDLSPGMLAVARENHPGLRFTEGSMTALDLADGALGGIVAWYSIIHIPPPLVPDALAEFHRVLTPGGQLLLAFQVGEEPFHLAEAFGRTVELDFHRWAPERLAELLVEAGFVVHARLVREADGAERTPQAYVLAHRA